MEVSAAGDVSDEAGSGGWQGLSPAGPLDCTRGLGAGLSEDGFQGGEVVKNLPANAGDTGDAISIPGLGRSPGEGNGNPLQCSCLENPMDRGAWQAPLLGVANSQRRVNTNTSTNHTRPQRT